MTIILSITNILLFLAIVVISSFFFWRGLKEDLEDNLICKITVKGWFIAISSYIGYLLLSRLFLLPLVFGWWLAFLFSTLTIIQMAQKTFSFWRIIDRYFFTVIFVTFIYLIFSISNINLLSNYQLPLLFYIIILVAYVLTIILAHSYRRFSWYKSGRLGFIAFVSLIYLGFTRLIVVIWFSSPVYWWQIVDCAIATLLIIFGILGVYSRSGRTFFDEIKNIRHTLHKAKVTKVILSQHRRKKRL